MTPLHLHQTYEFHGVIASGAFGTVYRVVNRAERNVLALKVLQKAQVLTQSGLDWQLMCPPPQKKYHKIHCLPQFVQIIKDNAIVQLKNEADIQTVCGHNKFIVELIAFWQSRREIYLRM